MSLVDLGKRLLEAAKQGHTDEVRGLMSNGAPFTTDWLGTSPLHFASMYGHMDTAEVLLRAGISRDARTKVDRTPLHVAAQEGHFEIVDLLVRNGADVEAKDMLKMTPLHWAVEKAHFPVIELLIQHGSDVSCKNKFDKSPIDIANFNGRPDIAEVLQLHKQTVVEVSTEQQVIEEVTATETVAAELVNSDQLVVSDNMQPIIIKGEVEDEVETTSKEGTEQNSTAVLDTLAAVAEATGPMSSYPATTNSTASEALRWLETHGITMISNSDTPTIVTSDPNQTLTLTEAGKLALNFVKQQGGEVVDQEEDGSDLSSGNVITIVTDQNQLQSGTEENQPVVVTLASSVSNEDYEGEPPLKQIKLEEEAEDGQVGVVEETAVYEVMVEDPDQITEAVEEEEVVVEFQKQLEETGNLGS